MSKDLDRGYVMATPRRDPTYLTRRWAELKANARQEQRECGMEVHPSGRQGEHPAR